MIEKGPQDYKDKSEIGISPLSKILLEQNQNIENISFVEMIQEAVLCIGQYVHAQKNKREIDVNIQKVHQKTIEMICNLPELLMNDGKPIVVQELRKQVIQHIKLLNAYYYECSYVYEILNDKLGLAIAGKKVLPKPKVEDFYKEIAAYLSKDIEKMPYKMSDLLSILPSRMTKQFFLDRVYTVLEEYSSKIPTNEWEDTIQGFKEQFYGKAYPGYGDSFPTIYDKTEALGELSYKKMDEGQIQFIAKDTHQLMQNILRLRQTFQIYGRILNRMLLLKELNFKDLHREIGKGMKLQGLFESFCHIATANHLEQTTENISLEQLYETCRIQKDQLTEDMQQLATYFNKVVKKESTLEDQEIQTFIKKSQRIIAISDDLNTEDIDKVLKIQEVGFVVEKDPAILQGFVEYMDDLLKEMPGELRRVRMKRLFSLIPIPFKSPEEFFEYVKNCLEFNTGDTEKSWMIDRVREQMKKV